MPVRRIWNTLFGPKLMRPELRKEMLRTLEDLSKTETEAVSIGPGVGSLRVEAIQLLFGNAALSEVIADKYRITLRGYEYYKELKAPRKYWVKKNWFPVAVLILSSVVTVVSSLIVVLLG